MNAGRLRPDPKTKRSARKTCGATESSSLGVPTAPSLACSRSRLASEYTPFSLPMDSAPSSSTLRRASAEQQVRRVSASGSAARRDAAVESMLASTRTAPALTRLVAQRASAASASIRRSSVAKSELMASTSDIEKRRPRERGRWPFVVCALAVARALSLLLPSPCAREPSLSAAARAVCTASAVFTAACNAPTTIAVPPPCKKSSCARGSRHRCKRSSAASCSNGPTPAAPRARMSESVAARQSTSTRTAAPVRV